MTDKFRNWLLVNGASYNTTQNYEYRIERVLRLIPEESLSKETLEAFLLKLQAKHKPSTINGYLNAIRSYLKFIGKEIELPSALKEPKTLPSSFDEKYLEETLIPTISQVLKYDYLKYRALFYFLFFSGIRISEIEHLERKHFDLKNRTAKIYMKKTKEERIVFFNDRTQKAIEEYFYSEPEETNAFNLKVNTFKTQIYRLKPYFPEMNVHTHLFRHGYALNLLRKGVDLLSVSKLLGHRSINSTMRYLGLTTNQMKEIYDKKIK